MPISNTYRVSLWFFVILIPAMVSHCLVAVAPGYQRLVDHGSFFTPATVQFSAEDIELVKQMIAITSIPKPVVWFGNDAEIASISLTIITSEDTGTTLQVPCIELYHKRWITIAREEKLFILLHEAAHYLHGDCFYQKADSVMSYVIDRYGTKPVMYAAAISLGLSTSLLFNSIRDIVYKKNLSVTHSIVSRCFLLSGCVSALCYALCRGCLKQEQHKEYLADIKAAELLQDASGGVCYFQRGSVVELSNKKYQWLVPALSCARTALEVVGADYCLLSTHPSDYARIAYLKAWHRDLV